MGPLGIKEILDIAWKAKQNGKRFNPLFTGAAGLGKSEIVKQWVDDQRLRDPDFMYIDFRLAYLEAPDFIGLPSVTQENEHLVTKYSIPDIWPRDPNARGIIVFEELNRGTSSTMNCLMQILTDSKVHTFSIPDNFIFCGCINEGQNYDTNTVDTALKNRFVEFPIEYDHKVFVNFAEKQNYNENIISFIKSGTWIYKKPEDLKDDATYVSPRSWSMVNAAESTGLTEQRKEMHAIVVKAILGEDIGSAYHKFCFDDAPVAVSDLIAKSKKVSKLAWEKLERLSNPDQYRGDSIAITVEQICKAYGGYEPDLSKRDSSKIYEDDMIKVAKIIAGDHSVTMLKKCIAEMTKQNTGGNASKVLSDFMQRNPDLVPTLRSAISVSKMQ